MNIISRELLSIASEINTIANNQNIANEEEKYENFTGQVKWEETSGIVKNAHIELTTISNHKTIVFRFYFTDSFL